MIPSILTQTRKAPPRIIMEMIKRCSSAAPFLFRVYNHVLKRFAVEYVARTYYGARLHCNLDDLIARTILHFGFWEPNNSAVISHILEPGDVFVDIGANIGYYTLLGSGSVGTEGKVVAIEASRNIFEQLQENVALNGGSNIRLISRAVADQVGELPLYGGTRWNRGSTSTVAQQPDQQLEETVISVPLDSLLSDDEIARLTLIKIDIEGGEPAVLQRLLDTLEMYPKDMMILAELAPQLSHSRLRLLFNRLRAAGFRTFALDNEYDVSWYLKWRRPAALQEIDTLPPRQTDVLFVRGSRSERFDGWQPASLRMPTRSGRRQDRFDQARANRAS
jgi:FkbM family methyltransferase